VVFDYDKDGDEDIFVSNGPGVAHSLFTNLLVETGTTSFVDVGTAAGVAGTSQDGTGACAADIDNDNDVDLYVVSTGPDNILFLNNGDGTFTDVTATAGVGGAGRNAVGCSFGDVDNDGLVDLVVANTYDDWNHRIPLFLGGPTYPRMEHNQLYINQGNAVFTDETALRGLENVSNMSGPGLTGAAWTWAISMVDYDGDGDTDIVSADNQGGPKSQPSEERGWVRIFNNDGTGFFTDITQSVGTDVEGGWMGLAFGDINCDGNLDYFATNLGEYLTAASRSSVYIQDDNGNFSFGGPQLANGFGWGAVGFDYDNDADTDFLYYGGVDLLQAYVADHYGTLVQNTGVCSGVFNYDLNTQSVDHRFRSDQGVAIGDLNDDGFFDVVTVANFSWTPDNFLLSASAVRPPTGSPLDPFATFQFIVFPFTPGQQTWANPSLPVFLGDMTVELNSADNGNNWAKVRVRGSVGDLPNGVSNRDGIGALVSFTPDNGPTSMQPVLGGSSYASRSSLEIGFGLGAETAGTLDVLWPGGVRNRLYNVQAGERVTMPEVPCSYDGDFKNQGQFVSCVTHALNDLRGQGIITQAERQRLFDSAKKAWKDEN
jgi:hypothetical protein